MLNRHQQGYVLQAQLGIAKSRNDLLFLPLNSWTFHLRRDGFPVIFQPGTARSFKESLEKTIENTREYPKNMSVDFKCKKWWGLHVELEDNLCNSVCVYIYIIGKEL